MKYTVKENQSVIDIALQLYGDVSYVVKLCVENELELNGELVAGTELLIDDAITDDVTLATTYRLRELTVNTDSTIAYEPVVAGAQMLEHNETEHTASEHN